MGYIKDGKFYPGSPPTEVKRVRKHPGHSKYVTEEILTQHRKDIIQPYVNGKPNPEFIKAYPKESENYGFVNKEEKNHE